MDLQVTEEQQLIRESAEKFFADQYGPETFRTLIGSDARWSPGVWEGFAEMGWLGLPFPEDAGGFGMGPAEVVILMERFGRELVLEPYVSSVIHCGKLIELLGTDEQREALLGEIASGQLRLAFAHNYLDGSMMARQEAGAFLLSGAKRSVYDAPIADIYLVSCSLHDGTTAVFSIPADANGITARSHNTLDGRRYADLDFADVRAQPDAQLGSGMDAEAAIDEAMAWAVTASCADAVGAISAMVEQTVDYAKQREQFGQPISKFQVLQHRLVEMKIAEEEARASVLLAALSLDGDSAMRLRVTSGAKAKVGRAARFVHQAAIQIHGAIGTTDELMLGWYAKRLVAFEKQFSPTRTHLGRYAELISDPETAAAPLLREATA